MPYMKDPKTLVEKYMRKAEELLEKSEAGTLLEIQRGPMIEIAKAYIELAKVMNASLQEEQMGAIVKVIDDSMHVFNTRFKEGVDILRFK